MITAVRIKQRNRGWLSVLMTAFFAIAATGVTFAQEEELDDSEIGNVVDDQLILDPAVPAHRVTVEVNEGIVSIDGVVNNILAKDRATDVAGRIKGVRAVVNSISVSAPYRSDIEIREDVEDALASDPATESWEVTALVDMATVKLEGEVDSWQERQLAATVVKGVRGVTEVVNDLQVDLITNRNDIEIQHEIDQALHWDVYIDDALVEVEVDDGNVTLSGTVGSAAEKSRASTKAWVAGVRSVDHDDLEVAYWARNEKLRRDKYEDKTEEEIREAVTDAFIYDPRVSVFDIDVTVEAGTVTLRGAVNNLNAKNAAARDAQNVVGVWNVQNRIKVTLEEPPSDNRIAQNVEAALKRSPYVQQYEIMISVNDGKVYFSGRVDTPFEKNRAAYLASLQKGVVEVKNFLSVSAPEVTPYDHFKRLYPYDGQTQTAPEFAAGETDWGIKQAIQKKLYWSPFVDVEDVEVTVDDGEVTLEGTVDTWNERHEAEIKVWEAGATRVNNRLKVEYGPEYYQP